MTSVLTGISQTSRSGSHFLSVLAAGTVFLEDATQGTATHLQGLQAVTATNGLVRADGATIVLDNANTRIALLNTTISNYSVVSTLACGSVMKDIGKNVFVFSQGNTSGVTEMFAVLTRVELVLGGGSEGESVRTGYIVTWSAQPTKSLGSGLTALPVTVARIGYGHAF